MQQLKLIVIVLLFFVTPSLIASAGDGNPTELGKVTWIRNFDEGIAKSATENKPVFLLFQEVPGCSTCQNYGQNVLSHPLIVEAIESLFVPVAIFNNKRGADAKVLDFYREPSWNNPVVRIVDAKKENLINRVNGNYTQLGIVQAMREALQVANKDVPNYLSLLEEELLAERTGTNSAVFSMYCFWTGEKEIGKLDGVVETQAGFMNGREVVTIKYDPSIIEYEDLLTKSNKASCASTVYTEDRNQVATTKDVLGAGKVGDLGKFRQDGEPKYYLGKTVYRFIPMTQIQATKVNSLIGQRQLPNELLSPRQIELLRKIQANPNAKWKNAINKDFVEAWEAIDEVKGA